MYQRPAVQYFDNQYGEKNTPKAASFGFYSSEAGTKDFPDSPEAQDSPRSNTPLLTTSCSSRSNSSSVVSCKNCGNPDPQCTCHNSSEAESFIYQQSEGDWSRSPQSPSRVLTRRYRERVRQPSSLREVTPGPSVKPDESPELDDSTFRQNQNLYGTCGGGFTVPLGTGCSDLGLSLRPNVLSCNTKLGQSTEHGLQSAPSVMECDNCETDEAEEEDDDGDDQEDGENDEWSGQDDNLEAIVLEALQGNREMAAYLIPILHQEFRSECATNITQKIGPWLKCSPDTGATPSDQKSSSNTNASESPTNNRKRQRRTESTGHRRKRDDEDEDDEEEDDEQRSPNEFGGPADANGVVILRLACPFHKRDPIKYSVQNGAAEGTRKLEYRACAGPGFKNEQRLKEHLKRKHYPVQCDRCYLIFSGPDRSNCVTELQKHRQLLNPCQLKPATLKEGISEAQWANLEKKKSVKKQQATSRVEKWMEIWDIIFPGIQRPDTPWYDNTSPTGQLRPPSLESEQFAGRFRTILDHQVKSQYIRFPEGEEEEMKQRVVAWAQKAFQLHLGMNGNQSTTESSSARSRQLPSVFDGSWERIPTPRTNITPRHSSSASRSTAARSQAFSGDVGGSPTATHPLRRQSSNMAPPTFMPMTHRQLVPVFDPNPVSSPISNNQITLPTFPMDAPDNMGATYLPNPFQENNYTSSGNNWMYDEPAPTDFDPNNTGGGMNPGSFVNVSRDSMDQNMIVSDAELQANWEHQQISGPRHMQYDRGQQ